MIFDIYDIRIKEYPKLDMNHPFHTAATIIVTRD